MQLSKLRVDKRPETGSLRPRGKSPSQVVKASGSDINVSSNKRGQEVTVRNNTVFGLFLATQLPMHASGSNEELLGAFFVGRATASLLNKRLGADIVEVATKGISFEWLQQRIKTREERIVSFREEVLKQAAAEMESQVGWVALGLEEAANSSPLSSPSATKVVDLQAEIDDLRATIAQARQTIRSMQSPSDAAVAKQ